MQNIIGGKKPVLSGISGCRELGESQFNGLVVLLIFVLELNLVGFNGREVVLGFS